MDTVVESPRRRGRPRGSKNKRKFAPAANPAALGPAAGPVAADTLPREGRPGSPTPRSPLREQYEATAKKLEAALAVATDPRDVAQIATTLNRTRWHIGQLSGEAAMTESKIVRSEAWTSFLSKLTPILARHPACLAEVTTFLESIVES